MFKVIINWYENYCQIDEDSDFMGQLMSLFPIQNKEFFYGKRERA